MFKFLIILIFLSSSSAINLRCSFNVHFISSLGRLGYACDARIGPTWNSTHIIGFSGVHRDGFTDNDVQFIRVLDGSELTAIPRGALNFFPNFYGLFLRGVRIPRLIGDELNEYPNLLWFAYELSEIEFVPGNILQPTPLLVSVSFGGNKIREVGEGLLDGLENLQIVYFLNNICINMAARNGQEIEVLKDVLRSQCGPLGN